MPGCERRARWQLASPRASSWFGRAKPAAREHAGGRSCEEPRKGERSLQALLSLPRPTLWRLLSRASRASTFHDIPQMLSSQASNLLVASCTLCSCKKTNVFWAYKEKERVKQKSKGRSSHLDRKSMVSVVWLFDNAHIKFVTLKLALPTRK